jgi:hypothetical protein
MSEEEIKQTGKDRILALMASRKHYFDSLIGHSYPSGQVQECMNLVNAFFPPTFFDSLSTSAQSVDVKPVQDEKPKDIIEWIDKVGLPATADILAELKQINKRTDERKEAAKLYAENQRNHLLPENDELAFNEGAKWKEKQALPPAPVKAVEDELKIASDNILRVRGLGDFDNSQNQAVERETITNNSQNKSSE